MFIGEYQHSVDEKGRVAVPAKFRADLATGAVVTKGLDSCLVLYTKKDWAELAEKVSQLPISQRDARAFARFTLGAAMEVEIDKQGRINLPNYLKEYAEIKKQAIVAGLYNRVEIWDEKKWKEYKQGAEKDSADIAEKLGDLGV